MGIHLATVLYRVSPRRRGPICGGSEMEPAEDGPPPSRGNTALYNIAAIDSEAPQTIERRAINLQRPSSVRVERSRDTHRRGARPMIVSTALDTNGTMGQI
ncbi:hypothetical protein C3E99_04315 [Sphingopyxis sp. MG]|nr:hypothetical protein C3E99_04315 [Sphingopyxis sp. MG]